MKLVVLAGLHWLCGQVSLGQVQSVPLLSLAHGQKGLHVNANHVMPQPSADHIRLIRQPTDLKPTKKEPLELKAEFDETQAVSYRLCL